MTDHALAPPEEAQPGVVRRLARRVDWDDPFARLALTHALGMSGEALLALSLAGSLFFKTDPAQGRQGRCADRRWQTSGWGSR